MKTVLLICAVCGATLTLLLSVGLMNIQELPVGSTAPAAAFRDCPSCPEMVVIPNGTFRMGSPTDKDGQDEWRSNLFSDSEQPQHEVTLQSFALGRFEVTQEEFAVFAHETGLKDFFKDPEVKYWPVPPPFPKGTDSHPAMGVSWKAARSYVAWLSQRTGKKYRLPSEAEWEYAARGGTTSARYWGDDESAACMYANVSDSSWIPRAVQERRAFLQGISSSLREIMAKTPEPSYHNCSDGFSRSAPVGSFKENAFGLYDVLGNVWEWVEDCSNIGYHGAPTDGSPWTKEDPLEPGVIRKERVPCLTLDVGMAAVLGKKRIAGPYYQGWRIQRGGSWKTAVSGTRAAARSWRDPSITSEDVGLRVARSLPWERNRGQLPNRESSAHDPNKRRDRKAAQPRSRSVHVA